LLRAGRVTENAEKTGNRGKSSVPVNAVRVLTQMSQRRLSDRPPVPQGYTGKNENQGKNSVPLNAVNSASRRAAENAEKSGKLGESLGLES
jgi:hypothetical protein